MALNVVILAAGLGKRMCSSLPKVLHPIAGKPLLEHIISTASELNPSAIFIIYGHGGEQVRQQLQHLSVQWIEQKQQLGTGHAVAQAIPHIQDNERVLILLGDAPLITVATLQKLLQETPENAVGLVTVHMPDPTGLGRVLRDASGAMIAVVEEKEASATQRKIQEINTGIMVVPAQKLKQWLPKINNNNASGEYYLPDIIALAVTEKMAITTVAAESPEEVQGINDRAQLAMLERAYQRRVARKLMLAGVTLKDPERFDVRGEITCAMDVTFDINVILEGKISIGKNSTIGPNVVLRNVTIGDNVVIKANCVLEEAQVADGCTIGPFARVRPGTKLAANVHVGNFVEIKNAVVGAGTKINHLTYVGDATIGKTVNIGAGTITCNYDGANKHHTIIDDNVFIGSGTELVAPIKIGEGATIGAGSTITRDAPANALTLRRADQQKTINNWQRPVKKDK